MKLNFSFNKLLQGSDSSEFLFKEWAGNHFEVDLHFDKFAPILDFCFYGSFFTDFNNFTDQIYDFMMMEILHLLVS